MSTESRDAGGYVRNCIITPREGDGPLFVEKARNVLCFLDGYRIEPVERAALSTQTANPLTEPPDAVRALFAEIDAIEAVFGECDSLRAKARAVANPLTEGEDREPVAWRYREAGTDGPWRLIEKPWIEEMHSPRWEHEPLYRHPAPREAQDAARLTSLIRDLCRWYELLPKSVMWTHSPEEKAEFAALDARVWNEARAAIEHTIQEKR